MGNLGDITSKMAGGNGLTETQFKELASKILDVQFSHYEEEIEEAGVSVGDIVTECFNSGLSEEEATDLITSYVESQLDT